MIKENLYLQIPVHVSLDIMIMVIFRYACPVISLVTDVGIMGWDFVLNVTI